MEGQLLLMSSTIGFFCTAYCTAYKLQCVPTCGVLMCSCEPRTYEPGSTQEHCIHCMVRGCGGAATGQEEAAALWHC